MHAGDRSRGRVRLLLIAPDSSIGSAHFKDIFRGVIFPERLKASMTPLGLATVAALCPEDWEVTILDENADQQLPQTPAADIVGVGGMTGQEERQLAILRAYKERGYFTVVGGPQVSLYPDKVPDAIVDAKFLGEVELTWPRFCRDFVAGRTRRVYEQRENVDLSRSPVPRFDLLDTRRYYFVNLQTSRGCPYSCEFCEIPAIFGKRARYKSPEQVCRELEAVRRLRPRGGVAVFDDNFIGSFREARRILEAIEEYQRERDHPFSIMMEMSLNAAKDETFVRLLARAGVSVVFLGIESPDRETLQQIRKPQNTVLDAREAVRRFYATGITIYGGFIFGLDGDTHATFDRVRDYIIELGITYHTTGLLNATPATPLYARLKREGRILEERFEEGVGAGLIHSNVRPRNMRLDELQAGYLRVMNELTSARNTYRALDHKYRAFGKLPVPERSVLSRKETVGSALRFLWDSLVRDPARLPYLALLLARYPRQYANLFTNWFTQVNLQRYFQRLRDQWEHAPRARLRRLAPAQPARRARRLGVQ